MIDTIVYAFTALTFWPLMTWFLHWSAFDFDYDNRVGWPVLLAVMVVGLIVTLAATPLALLVRWLCR